MKTTIKERTGIYGNKIIDEFNENNQLIKSTVYKLDGNTILHIYEYNPQTGEYCYK